MNSKHMSKVLLRVFVVSICVTAVAGVVALVVPAQDWEFSWVILATTATIAGASVCGLACGGCLSRGHRVLPTAGMILTSLAAVMVIAGIWMEYFRFWAVLYDYWPYGTAYWAYSEVYWKSTFVVSAYAVACAHLSLLFMAELSGRYRWAFLFAYQLILGLATLLAVAVIFERFPDETYWRMTGVVAVLVAAVTLLIPVFHRLSREQVAKIKAAADPLLAVEEEIARVKKRLLELESQRRVLLGREGNVLPAAQEQSE